MSMITLYLFTILDKIGLFCNLTTFFCFLSVVGMSMYYAVEREPYYGDKDEHENKMTTIKKWNIRFIKIGFLFLLISAFIPSTKEIAFIYIVGKVSQNEQVQEVPEKALKILNAKLEEYLKDFDKTDGK